MIQKISFGKISYSSAKSNKPYMEQILRNKTDKDAAVDAFIRIGETSDEYGVNVFLDIIEDRAKDDCKNLKKCPVELMITDESNRMIVAQTFDTKYTQIDGNNKENFEKLAENFVTAMEEIHAGDNGGSEETTLDLNV